ncbi:hypothetical protein SUNI508_13976 [Seiridium unicorne]|uniref:Uncharacterized protein n=1 Tax=Seiridium unicorne TaxID=138068 RepID=A0ABR2V9S0_9PEZI
MDSCAPFLEVPVPLRLNDIGLLHDIDSRRQKYDDSHSSNIQVSTDYEYCLRYSFHNFDTSVRASSWAKAQRFKSKCKLDATVNMCNPLLGGDSPVNDMRTD